MGSPDQAVNGPTTLLRLSIENVGLIERAELDFAAGLTVVTGETGSGKTMLLGGLALALGGRADGDTIRQGAERARAVLEVAPLGAIGVHPSLLPRHRGPDPYFWAIESGDLETGVTAHRLEEEYDTGAILAQRRLAIDASWNSWTRWLKVSVT